MNSKTKVYMSYITSLVILVCVCVLLAVANLQTPYLLHCQNNQVDYLQVNYWSNCYTNIANAGKKCYFIGMNMWPYLFTLPSELPEVPENIFMEQNYQYFNWNDASKFSVLFTILEALVFLIFLMIMSGCQHLKKCVPRRKTFAFFLLFQMILLIGSCTVTTFWLEWYYNKNFDCHYSWGYFLLYVCLLLELVGLVPMCFVLLRTEDGDELYEMDRSDDSRDKRATIMLPSPKLSQKNSSLKTIRVQSQDEERKRRDSIHSNDSDGSMEGTAV